VKENPPAKDGLTVEECERIIISLLLENVLATNPIWNAYEYVKIGECLVPAWRLGMSNPSGVLVVQHGDLLCSRAIGISIASSE
jgi:hypothetical protein